MGFIKPNNNSGGSGGGLTPQELSRLNNAYTHSKSEHAPTTAEQNVQPDWNETDTTSDAYIKNKPDLSQIGSGGGILSVTQVEPQELDMPRVFFYGNALPTSKTDVLLTMDYISNTDKFSAYIKLKCQGTSSMNYAKKNFTINMYSDEARKTKLKKDFKGWGKQSKFCLKANYVDTTHTRNLSGARIACDMVNSRPDSPFKRQLSQCPRNGAVDGFPIKLYFNGEFYGIYTWNIPKDDWMFNMDKTNPNHVVLCAERNTDGNSSLINSCQFRKLWTDGDGGDWSVEVGTYSTDMVASLNRCINFVMTSTDQEFHDNIGEYFDLYSLLDYYCFSYLTCHLDGLAKNMLMATYDGVIWGACLYDMDSIYGVHWNGNSYVATNYQCPEQYQEQFSLLWQRIERCFGVELYTRYLELRQGALSLSNIVKHVEEIYDVIPDRVFADEKAKWTSLPQVNTNTMTRFRNYMKDRAVYVDAQMQEIGTKVPCTGITLDKHELVISSSTSEQPSDVTIDITQNITNGSLIRGSWAIGVNGGMSSFGNISTNTADRTTDFIPFTSNNTLTISQPSTQYGCGLVAYDSNKQALACYTTNNAWEAGDTQSSIDVTALTVNVTTPPANTAYIRISFNLTDLSGVTVIKKSTGTVVSSHQLTATVTPDNCTQPVVWNVDPAGIVTVNNGLVRAVTNGEATVTATCGSQSDTCAVTVSGMSESGGDTDTTLLYSLPEETVFNGTSTYIDTGVALLSTDQDFTIVLDVTATESQNNSQATIFHCMHEERPWLGLSCMTSDNVDGFYIPRGNNVTIIGQNPYLILKNIRTKVVVIKEGTTLSAYNSNNVTSSSNYTYTQVNENLLIGAYQTTSGVKGRYFLGTVHDFKIYNKAFTSEEKDTYLDININNESSRVFKIDSTCMNTTDNTLTDNIAGISATLTGNPTVSGNQIVFTASDKFSFDISSLNLTNSNRTFRIKFTPTTLDTTLRNIIGIGNSNNVWDNMTSSYITSEKLILQHGLNDLGNVTVGSPTRDHNGNRLSVAPVTGQEYELVISENTDGNVRWYIDGTLVQNGTTTLFNPLYLSNTEGINRFIGSYSLIEIYNGYCNDYTEFTNMVNNASSGVNYLANASWQVGTLNTNNTGMTESSDDMYTSVQIPTGKYALRSSNATWKKIRLSDSKGNVLYYYGGKDNTNDLIIDTAISDDTIFTLEVSYYKPNDMIEVPSLTVTTTESNITTLTLDGSLSYIIPVWPGNPSGENGQVNVEYIFSDVYTVPLFHILKGYTHNNNIVNASAKGLAKQYRVSLWDDKVYLSFTLDMAETGVTNDVESITNYLSNNPLIFKYII